METVDIREAPDSMEEQTFFMAVVERRSDLVGCSHGYSGKGLATSRPGHIMEFGQAAEGSSPAGASVLLEGLSSGADPEIGCW